MFPRFKKKKETKTEKVPTKRKCDVRLMRRLITGLTLFLVLSGGFAFVLAYQAKIKAEKANDTVSVLQEEVKKQEQANLLYTPEIESFMNRFVALYMSGNPNDSNDEKRIDTLLNDFFATGFKKEDVYLPVKRNLDSASFYALKEKDGVATATYKVTYTITELDKEQLNGEKEITQTQLINIPFVQKEEGLRIVAPIYFASVPLNKSEAEILSYQTEDYERVESLSLKEELSDFAEEFFAKYAESNATDMSYMMDHPEGLENTVVVKTVTSEVFQSKENKDVYVIHSFVQFADVGTTLTHNEQMTLYVTKKLEKWYVEKLAHTFKNNERKGE